MKTLFLFVSLATAAFGAVAIPPGDINPLPTGTILGRTVAGTGAAAALTTIPTAVQDNITRLGTVASGVWNGTVVAGQYGGTGVANTGKTITLGGNLTTSGAFATTVTVTGTTNVTLPTSGTLVAGGAITSSGLTMSTSRLLGRTTASSGAVEEISAGNSISLSGGSIDAIQDIRTTASPTFNNPTLTKLTFTTHTTSAGGIALTSDTLLFRIQVGGVALASTNNNPVFKLYHSSTTSAAQWEFYQPDNAMYFTSVPNGSSVVFRTNGGTTAMTLASNQTATFASSITTSAPNGGTAGAWKHGVAVTTSGLTLSTTVYVQLDVGGTLYKMATVN